MQYQRQENYWGGFAVVCSFKKESTREDCLLRATTQLRSYPFSEYMRPETKVGKYSNWEIQDFHHT